MHDTLSTSIIVLLNSTLNEFPAELGRSTLDEYNCTSIVANSYLQDTLLEKLRRMKREEERELEKRAEKKGAEREETKWLKKLSEMERWLECVLEPQFLRRLRQQATTGAGPAPPPDNLDFHSGSLDSSGPATAPPFSPAHSAHLHLHPHSHQQPSFPSLFPYNGQQQPQPEHTASSSGAVPSPYSVAFPTPPPYDSIGASPSTAPSDGGQMSSSTGAVPSAPPPSVLNSNAASSRSSSPAVTPSAPPLSSTNANAASSRRGTHFLGSLFAKGRDKQSKSKRFSNSASTPSPTKSQVPTPYCNR